jgi:uncharacterized YceG family protein
MSGNYGRGGDGTWPPANDPQRDDSVWQQDQPSPWTGQENPQPGYDQQPYGQQQPRDGQPSYDGRGYGGQDYDQGQGYPGQAYPGQGYGGQTREQPGYDGRNYGQPDPRTRPGYPQQGPGTGPQQYPQAGPQQAGPPQAGRGTGGQQIQRGSGGMQQVPPGYDPRGTGPRRPVGGGEYPSGGYPQRAEAGYGQRDDSFLPGFGPRDDFEGGDQQNGGDQQYDPRRGGPRRTRDGRADGPATDPRSAEFAQQDLRTRGDRRRARDDDRDPRGQAGPTRPARRDRDDWDGAYGNGGNGGPGGYDDGRPPRRRRGPVRRLAPWIALLVIVVPLAWGALHVYGIYQGRVHPADYTGAGTAPTVTVQVPNDASAVTLAPTLLKDGVIASTRAFVNAANATTTTTSTAPQLEPGYFELKTHMQASVAWADLTNPKNMVQTVVTIPEGKRASQVIAIVAKQTKIPLKDFQTALAHPSELGLPKYADGKVEGYLFPATYAIVPHETALQILQAMVTRYNQEATAIDLPAAAQRLGISETDVIIEASMAQAEGGSVSDYPKIAEVINNRLRIHMALQFDSVLLYGLNKYAINVTDKQIATPGPYNDFEHSGLPPGPIANPGDAAIQGILHPATGNWLYFLTVSGGKSEFSATPLAGQ